MLASGSGTPADRDGAAGAGPVPIARTAAEWSSTGARSSPAACPLNVPSASRSARPRRQITCQYSLGV